MIMLKHHHCACNKMNAGIFIFCVISLTSFHFSLTLDISGNKHSTGNKDQTECDGQITDDKDSCPESDALRSSTLNIKKRDIRSRDNEGPLILTPYIETGKQAQALALCEVKSDKFLGVKSYSGFLTVDKWRHSNLFFWYFPVENQKVRENPWIIWLQGGPGSSSMDGLFNAFGPYNVRYNYKEYILEHNPHTWLKSASLVFIDNPVGTGYSFTDYKEGYAKDMATYALHLKTAVLQLLQLFPELKVAPLFVAGESYGGKYAPALAMELHKAKESVNLKGVFTGNGLVDASILRLIPETYYEAGFLSMQQHQTLELLKDGYMDDMRKNRSALAREKYHKILGQCIELSEQNAYNLLTEKSNYETMHGRYTTFLKRKDVRRAIHVGNVEFSPLNETVSEMLAGEFLTSARPLYNDLLYHGYKVMGYCGMLDLLLPCYAVSDEYREWSWQGKQEFIGSSKIPLVYSLMPSGYYKTGGNLTEILLRGAGHYAALDQPGLVQKVVDEWIHGRPHNATFWKYARVDFENPTDYVEY